MSQPPPPPVPTALELVTFVQNFKDQNGPQGGQENKFWLVSNTKLNVHTVKAPTDPNGVICLITMFPSSLRMVLILSKVVHVLQICANMSKSGKVIYICTSESDMLYWVLINSSQVIEDLIIKETADTAEI